MPSADLAGALRSARATIAAAAERDDARRLVAPAIAELDRAIALLDPGAARDVVFTPVGDTEPDAGSFESMRRELERLRLAEGARGLLETLLEQTPHGVIVSDAEGRLILQNPAAERIWAGSATADSVEGYGRFRAFHPDGRPFEPDDWALARCLRTREVVEARELHIQRFDGTHGWVLGSTAPLVDADGELLGAVTTFADITRLKLIEEEDARRAVAINDLVVQSLTVASMAMALGRTDEAKAALDEALEAARRMVSDLLRGAAGDAHVAPGSLRRLAASE